MLFFRPKKITAIDLGSDSIKIIQLVKKRAWVLELNASYKFEKAGGDHASAALEAAVKETGIKGERVLSFMPPSLVFISQLTVPLMPESELQRAAAWEAARLLSIPVQELEVRAVPLGKVMGPVGQPARLKVLLAAVTREKVYSFHQIFEQVGLKLAALDLSLLCLLRVYVSSKGFPKPVGMQAVLDVGKSCSHLLTTWEGSILTTDLLPVGIFQNQEEGKGRHRELVSALKVTFEANRQKGPGPSQLIITGGGSMDKDLLELLSAELNLPVTRGIPSLTDRQGTIRSLEPPYAMAVGLALGGCTR